MIKQLNKKKHMKWFIFLLAILSIIIWRIYLNSPYTHVEERKIINYALQGSRDKYKLLRCNYYSEENTIIYDVIAKGPNDVDKLFKMRSRMNEYLENNPEYYLNNDYIIELGVVGHRSGGPLILYFTNSYGYKISGLPRTTIRQFDSIDCLYLSSMDYLSLKDISDSTLYEDIKGLVVDRYGLIDAETLKHFKSLEFFKPNDRFTDEDIEKLKEMFPDCEIYDN